MGVVCRIRRRVLFEQSRLEERHRRGRREHRSLSDITASIIANQDVVLAPQQFLPIGQLDAAAGVGDPAATSFPAVSRVH